MPRCCAPVFVLWKTSDPPLPTCCVLWDLHCLKLVCGMKLKLDFVVASSQHTLLSRFTEAGLGVAIYPFSLPPNFRRVLRPMNVRCLYPVLS
jgi:hypothetical protein